MIHLIGGPPRCGKSTLAQWLCRRKAVPWISTDPLVQMLGEFDAGLRDVDEDRFTDYAERVWPHLRRFILHAATCAEDITIEGDTFLPTQAASLAEEIPIRVCFLGTSRTSVAELKARVGHNDWLLHASPEVRDRMPEWIARRSGLIASECATFGLPYIDLVDDWPAGMAAAHAVLLGSASEHRAESADQQEDLPPALRGGPAPPGTVEWHRWLGALLAEHQGPIRQRTDDGGYLVTFVYVAEPETATVALFTALTEQGPYGCAMSRVPGTQVFWLSVPVDADVVTSYQFGPDARVCSPDEFLRMDDSERTAVLTERATTLLADPVAPDVIRPTATDPTEELPRHRWASVLAMPHARPTPWLTPRAGIGSGVVRQATFDGGAASAARPVWCYVPPSGLPPGLLVLLDGGVWQDVISVPTMVDNLAADGLLAAPAVVLVGHPAQAARDVEYRCSPAFADLLADRLVPWATREFGLADPDSGVTAVGGLARGGLAAVHAVLTRGDVLGAAIALSGSFWWSPPDDPEPEWLTRTLAPRKLTPARFWLAAGRLEHHVSAARKRTSTLSTSRSLANALSHGGHDVHYEVFPGGHEAVPHRATMADALVWLFPPPSPPDRPQSPVATPGRKPHRAG